ncbi:cytochrome P450 714C2-like [Cornus florida]|uniref:cytochrome P450 714C2-like n=1 Tax=Cornus florida TaxID=4283 RepID=UPI00289E88C5|nr:cytochrome P450 714C2-like [Cornus florida]
MMMDTMIWLIVVCSICLYMHLYNVLWVRPERMRGKLRRQGIKGPPPSFLMGNVSEMKRITSNQTACRSANEAVASSPTANYSLSIFPYFESWRRIYGQIYMYTTGNVQNLYISDPAVLKEISLFKSLDLGRPVYAIPIIKSLFGNGIARSNGQVWAHQRKVIAPEFFVDKVKDMVGMMVESALTMVESALTMVKSWEAQVEGMGGEADIRVDEDLAKFSMNTISKACFGSMHSKGKHVFELIRSLQKAISYTSVVARIPFLGCFPTKTNIEVWKLEREIRESILKLVKDGSGKSDQKDLLQVIQEGAYAEQLGEETTNCYVVDNCKSIYVAGHETVASVATWTLMLLAAFPEWQTQARDEVINIFQGHPPDADSLHKLKMVTMVIQETMRLYPPIPFTAREALEDLNLGDIYIPKGVNLWIPITTLHRLPEIWGEDADEFKPERFAHGIYGACKFPQAYIPFGIGPHICLGQKFAMVELKILMSLLLSKFSFSISPKYQHSPNFKLTLQAKYGLNLIVKKV